MNFHLFSALRAREALRTNVISVRDERNYWFGMSLIGLIGIYQSGYFGLQIDWFLVYDIAMAVAILWIGMNESFKANGGEAGVDFIRRLTIIGVPLGLTALLATQVLWFASWHLFPHLFDQNTFRNPAFVWHIVTFICWNTISVWFWWRMHHHISRLNGTYHD